MTTSWSEGYFVDFSYTSGYYSELSPAMMRLCLLLQRIQPPPMENMEYCELAFGHGVGLNIHAAACSGAFYGTDFNPEQVAFARALAACAGSELEIRDDSFEEYLKRDLPQFDYITLHGIWSWVTPQNRQYLVDFLKKNLKVGGAFYISYNCHPGWSGAAPLRQLFTLFDRYGNHDSSGIHRVRGALGFVEKLFQARPQYLFSNPSLQARLDHLKSSDETYVAHEYFNKNWDLMYFTEVADCLEEAKLSFAAPAQLKDNLPGLGMSAEAQEFLASLENPIMYQQMRDYFINNQFRKDIFVKGPVLLSGVEQAQLLRRERFILLTEPSQVRLSMEVGMGEVSFDPPSYGMLLDVLAENAFSPKTAEYLHSRLSDTFDLGALVAALIHMISVGAVSPCQPEEVAEKAYPRTRALNRELCRLARFREDIPFLASPVTGTGITITRMQMLFLAAEQQGENAPRYVWEALKASGEVLTREGKIIEDEGEVLAELEKFWERSRTRDARFFRALGLL